MSFIQLIQERIEDFCQRPGWLKFKKFIRTAWKLIRKICAKIYHYRAVILAVAVVACSVVLAVMSMAMLPEQVGINLLTDGSFSFMVPKILAVLFPFLITLVSLFFLLISKRTLYPWLISLFTLTIPALILVTNIFPS